MSLKGRWQDRINNFVAARAGIPRYVPIFAQIQDHAAWLAGVSIKEYLTNSQTFVKTAILVSEYYQLEFPMLVYDAYNIEVEALGQKLIHSDRCLPAVDPADPLVKSPADLARLRAPDPDRDGRMPFVREANQIYREITGLAPNLTYCGPLTLAIQLRGYEQFVTDTMTNPRFAHQLLSFVTEEVLAPWIDRLTKEASDSHLVIGVEAWASLPLSTMAMLEEYFVPYARRLQNLCGEVQVPIGGLWGESHLADPTRFLEMKIELGRGRDLSGFDPDVFKLGPGLYKRMALEHDIPLRLGVDANLIQNGPVGDLVERVRRYIAAGAPGGKFFLFLNNVPRHTRSDHVHAAVAAARAFGKYPLASDLDQIPFPGLDNIESFNDFVSRSGLGILI